MNLVNMAMRYVGPMVAERIASKLGLGGPVVNKLIAAALPTILGGVIGKSKSGAGLSSIMEMVGGANRPDPGGLEAMFNDGGDVDDFARQGGGMLEGLLGGQGMGAMADVLGRHAGVDKAQAGSILGMIAPAALGSIGSQVAEQGMDADGLASFLDGQKANVAAAMPAGLASELGGTGILDGVMDSLGGAGAAAATAATGLAASATAAASNAAAEVETGAKKSMGMMPWIIGLVALVLIGWFLFGRGAPDADLASVPGAEYVVGDVNVGEQFGEITGSLTSTFQGITDTASAEAALPQLEELTGQIGSLGDTVGQLGGDAKTGFQGIVATAISQLRPIIEGAIESSGAGAILQPVADQLLAALEGLAG